VQAPETGEFSTPGQRSTPPRTRIAHPCVGFNGARQCNPGKPVNDTKNIARFTTHFGIRLQTLAPTGSGTSNMALVKGPEG